MSSTSRNLYVDVETDGVGGFRPPTQSVMQWAWVIKGGSEDDIERNYFISDTRAQAVNPKVPHEISAEQCRRDGIPFEEVLAIFTKDLLECDVVCAHNLKFDLGCIRNELVARSLVYEEFDRLVSSKRNVCTMDNRDTCKLVNPVTKRFPKLEALYNTLFPGSEISHLGNLHDALTDCRVLSLCHAKLISTIRT